MFEPKLRRALCQIILTTDFNNKIRLGKGLTTHVPECLLTGTPEELSTLESPGRPQKFEVVAPRHVPKRGIEDLQNRIHFLHAIANIELLAVELPCLSLLRFGSSNTSFVAEQLHIIAEEAYHFEILQSRLKEFGCDFGSIPVHHGLWDWAWQCHSELEHQILIPCYLEARGLDVTPEFVRRFHKLGDTKTARIMQLILDEEIRHVRQGLKYLEVEASKRHLTTEKLFEDTLRHFFGNRIKSKVPLNRETRTLAGFSPEQIRLLAS